MTLSTILNCHKVKDISVNIFTIHAESRVRCANSISGDVVRGWISVYTSFRYKLTKAISEKITGK